MASGWPRDFGGASNDERLAFCIYHTRQIVNKSVASDQRASSPASKRFQLTEKDYSRIKALTQSPYLFYGKAGLRGRVRGGGMRNLTELVRQRHRVGSYGLT